MINYRAVRHPSGWMTAGRGWPRVRAGSGDRRLDWLAWVLVALATAALGARRRRPAIVLLITSAMTAVTVSLGYPLGLIWLAPLIALYARGPGDPGPTRRGRARPAARPADGRLADGDRPGPRRPGGAGAGRYPERRADPPRGAGAGRGRPGGDGGLPGPGAGRVHRGCPAGPGLAARRHCAGQCPAGRRDQHRRR